MLNNFSVGVEDFVELPALVIDTDSLFDHKGNIMVDKVRQIPMLFQEFNLHLWRDASPLSVVKNAAKYKRLDVVLDTEYANILQLSISDLVAFLAVHKTVILTNNPKLQRVCGERAWDQFDHNTILIEYPERSFR